MPRRVFRVCRARQPGECGLTAAGRRVNPTVRVRGTVPAAKEVPLGAPCRYREKASGFLADKYDMDISGIAGATMAQAESRLENVAKRVAEGPVDTVSLSDAAIELLQAKQQFQVGAAVLRTGFETEQTVLDLFDRPGR